MFSEMSLDQRVGAREGLSVAVEMDFPFGLLLGPRVQEGRLVRAIRGPVG